MANRKHQPDDWFACNNCGAEVSARAKACPECGADDETGWRDAYDTSHSVPGVDDDFDYDEFLENEFGEKSRVKPKNMSWWVWGSAILVIIALLLLWLR